jgi:hypothetical protein
MAGILYVVYNDFINNSEATEKLYKIGITKNSVSERYYGLGLKMPGKFETLFAYKLDDYAKAEQIIHGILSKYRENGEWFNLTQKELEHIKATCDLMGGTLVTDEINIEDEKENDTALSADDKKTLSINDAYTFFENKGLKDQIEKIKDLKSDNRATSVRRGYFITIAEEKGLLDEFIEKFWPFGKERSGKTKINYYKKLYHDRIN